MAQHHNDPHGDSASKKHEQHPHADHQHRGQEHEDRPKHEGSTGSDHEKDV